MKANTRIITTALLGSQILAGGCTKTAYVHRSGPIEFASSSRGNMSTKTVYGDDLTDETTKITRQALNWKTGDKITIASPQAPVQNDAGATPAHASDYVVTLVKEGVPSTGSLSNADVNGLMWDENYKGKYDFYAVYPNVGENVLSLDYSKGEFTAVIPDKQDVTGTPTTGTDPYPKSDQNITYSKYQPDMAYAFMSAATKGVTPPEGTEKVELKFFPAFTAFEFFVSSQDEEIELTEFEILSPEETDKLAGEFTKEAGEDGDEAVPASSATYSVKAAFPAETKVTKDNGLNFTVFTLPVTNTGALRLRFTSKDGENATKTSRLDLKYSDKRNEDGEYVAGDDKHGTPYQFIGGHKYRIHMMKLPASQWRITISADFDEWQDGEEVTIYI